MSRTILVANWKMHKTIEETKLFLEVLARDLSERTSDRGTGEIWIAPPFTAIAAAAQFIREQGLTVRIGAQNVAGQPQGAFTGEVSAAMLKEVGASFCIIGHSERRTLFQENDALIHEKIRMALAQDLLPLLCIGESSVEREQGRVKEVLRSQLAAALRGLTSRDVEKLCIAYEPIWAIGTGKTATPELAEEAHAVIRDFLVQEWGRDVAVKIPLLYGGSVKAENIVSLLKQPDIDGALIGGASLDPQLFVQLIRCVHT
jgi:triosephosphate isomerase